MFNVLEKYRRQGIGEALLADALADMKEHGFDTVILQTKAANAAARAIYEKHGFTLSFPVTPEALDCFYACSL